MRQIIIRQYQLGFFLVGMRIRKDQLPLPSLYTENGLCPRAFYRGALVVSNWQPSKPSLEYCRLMLAFTRCLSKYFFVMSHTCLTLSISLILKKKIICCLGAHLLIITKHEEEKKVCNVWKLKSPVQFIVSTESLLWSKRIKMIRSVLIISLKQLSDSSLLMNILAIVELSL